MNEWLQIALIVAGIACGLFPLFKLILRRDADPLDADADLAIEPVGTSSSLFGGGDDLRKLLLGAGYYHRTAMADYQTIRMSLTLAPIFLAAAAVLILPPQLFRTIVIFGGVSALLGFSLPRVWLAIQRRSRGREISRGLPLAVDNLTLCLTAGQNPLAAFATVAGVMKISHPVLAQELAITAKQAELHTLDTAVKQWAERAQVPEVSNLSSLLVQSERLGTDTASTLIELSNNFRTTARQRAETQANRTSFWMLFPSVFCFWVAAAIILIGPAYLQYFEYRDRVGPNVINNMATGMDRANRRRGNMEPADPNAPPPAPAISSSGP